MAWSFRRFFSLGSLVLGFAPTAAAAPAALDYQAPPDCPAEPQFETVAAARGARFERAALDGPTAQVRIRAVDSGYHGTLSIDRDGTMSAPREVHGETCMEVVDALAVVAAIALRQEEEAALPDQKTLPSPQEGDDATTAPPVPVEPRPERALPERPEAAPPLPKVTPSRVWPAPFSGRDRAIDVSEGTLHFEGNTGASALGGVVLGKIPGVAMPRIDVSLSRANFVTPPNGESYLVGPIWRVRVSLLANVETQHGEFTTEAGGESVGVGLCYSPYYDVGGLGLLACVEAAAEFMQLRTRDASGTTTQKKQLGNGTVGLGLEAVYNIGRHFHLASRVGADAAASAYTAERPDGSQLFSSSRVSGYAAVGLGGHW